MDELEQVIKPKPKKKNKKISWNDRKKLPEMLCDNYEPASSDLSDFKDITDNANF